MNPVKVKRIIQGPGVSLAWSLIFFSTVGAPVSTAEGIRGLEEMHAKVCSGVKPELSNVSIECQNSLSAIDLARASRTKAFINFAVASSCFTLAFSNAAPGAASKICVGLGMAGSLATRSLNSEAKSRIQDRVKTLQTTSQIESFLPLAHLAGGAAGMNASSHPQTRPLPTPIPDNINGPPEYIPEKADGNLLASARERTQAAWQQKRGCIISGVLASLQVALALSDRAAAGKANEVFLASARQHLETARSGNFIAYQSGNPNLNLMSSEINAAPSPVSTSEDPCSHSNGNDYLTCVNSKSPDAQIAALLSSPETIKGVEQVLNRSLGDALKQFQSSTDPDAMRAAASSLGGGLTRLGALSAIQQLGQKMAGELNVEGAGGVYLAKALKKKSLENSEPDLSKMMSELFAVPAREPAAREESPENPFAFLESLSPYEIERRKDISLFHRVGYRYSKKFP